MSETIRYETTTVSPNGRDHYSAIGISWEEATYFLGHKHDGSPEDDNRLVALLREAGVTDAWLDDAPGMIDEDGWYIYDTNQPHP